MSSFGIKIAQREYIDGIVAFAALSDCSNAWRAHSQQQVQRTCWNLIYRVCLVGSDFSFSQDCIRS